MAKEAESTQPIIEVPDHAANIYFEDPRYQDERGNLIVNHVTSMLSELGFHPLSNLPIHNLHLETLTIGRYRYLRLTFMQELRGGELVYRT